MTPLTPPPSSQADPTTAAMEENNAVTQMPPPRSLPRGHSPAASLGDLKAYVDGELGPVRRLLVRGHLARCAWCREEAEIMERISQRLRESEPAEPLSDALRARLLASAALAATSGAPASLSAPPPVSPALKRRGHSLFVYGAAGSAVAAATVAGLFFARPALFETAALPEAATPSAASSATAASGAAASDVASRPAPAAGASPGAGISPPADRAAAAPSPPMSAAKQRSQAAVAQATRAARTSAPQPLGAGPRGPVAVTAAGAPSAAAAAAPARNNEASKASRPAPYALLTPQPVPVPSRPAVAPPSTERRQRLPMAMARSAAGNRAAGNDAAQTTRRQNPPQSGVAARRATPATVASAALNNGNDGRARISVNAAAPAAHTTAATETTGQLSLLPANAANLALVVAPEQIEATSESVTNLVRAAGGSVAGPDSFSSDNQNAPAASGTRVVTLNLRVPATQRDLLLGRLRALSIAPAGFGGGGAGGAPEGLSTTQKVTQDAAQNGPPAAPRPPAPTANAARQTPLPAAAAAAAGRGGFGASSQTGEWVSIRVRISAKPVKSR